MVMRTANGGRLAKCPVCDKVFKLVVIGETRHIPRHGFKVGSAGGCTGSGLIQGGMIEPDVFQAFTLEQARFFDPKNLVTE